MPTKSLKNHPQKLLRKTQINFFFLTAWAAQMAQTEEFMFQNMAYRTTVYRTGAVTKEGRREDAIDNSVLFLQNTIVSWEEETV